MPGADDKSGHPGPRACAAAAAAYRGAMRLILCLFLLLATPLGAQEVRAVVVGVGDYLHLDADLKGPPQDAALIARALVARGVEPGAIAVLVTGAGDHLPPGVRRAGQPTRAAILAAMAAAGAAARPGDTVVFHFSGHGSLAPDRDGDEGGGADQIILPMDARGWRGAVGDVENAIYDDELQAWARGLLGRGVRVVGVLDACHSGTGFRAAPGIGVARAVDPALLGIPEGMAEAEPAPAAPLPGEFVFLYAARADQRAFEFPEGEVWHGAFSLAFARALAGGGELTWAEALALTRSTMARGATRQDPDGEGPLLTAPVFGSSAPPDRFLVEGGVVQAGLLDGLAEGTLVQLTDAGGGALGQSRLTGLTAAGAALDPAPPPQARWAEVLALPPPPPLRLAAPVRADPQDGQDYSPWIAALALAREEGLAVEAAPPDLVPVLTGGHVALTGPDGVLEGAPRIRPREGEDAAVATLRVIESAGHAIRLKALLAGMTGRGLGAGGKLSAATERRPGTGCRGRADPASGAPHDPMQGLAPCDEIWLTLRNGTGQALDVTVFYLAQDFTVTPVWPARNLSTRLEPGATARAGLRIEPDTPVPAAEEILVVALAPGLRAGQTPLARLATPERLRAAPSSDPLAPLAALLDPDTATRAFSLKAPDLTLLRLPLRVLPAP